MSSHHQLPGDFRNRSSRLTQRQREGFNLLRAEFDSAHREGREVVLIMTREFGERLGISTAQAFGMLERMQGKMRLTAHGARWKVRSGKVEGQRGTGWSLEERQEQRQKETGRRQK